MAYAIDTSKVDPFLKFQRIEWYDILLKFTHAFMEHEIMGESSVWSCNFYLFIKNVVSFGTSDLHFASNDLDDF